MYGSNRVTAERSTVQTNTLVMKKHYGHVVDQIRLLTSLLASQGRGLTSGAQARAGQATSVHILMGGSAMG
jgi:hypothetical protein